MLTYIGMKPSQVVSSSYFSSWFTFSKVVSPRETEYLLAISTLNCVSLKYLAIGTLRNSIVVGEDATYGTGCTIAAAAVVVIIDTGDGENITDRNTLSGIGVASLNLDGN